MADTDPTDPTWPTPSGRDAVLDRVLRGGRRRLMITRLAVAGAITAGALATGVALGVTDTVSVLPEGTVETGDALAGLRPCPDLEPVATLTGGDRVFLTGRSEDGAWLQLRSPYDADDRLWIDAALVTGDEEVDGLPVASCGDVELVLTLPDGSEVVVTTTTTTTPGETTTTTEPGETTTTASTVPGQTTQPTQPGVTTTAPPATTTPPPTTTTTTDPPDDTPPAISNFQRSLAAINEINGEFCTPPSTTNVSVTVTDGSSVTQVSVRYRITNAAGTTTYFTSGFLNMSNTSGTTWARAVGDVNQLLPGSADGVLRWEVRATDSEGNQSTQSAPGSRNVTVNNC